MFFFFFFFFFLILYTWRSESKSCDWFHITNYFYFTAGAGTKTKHTHTFLVQVPGMHKHTFFFSLCASHFHTHTDTHLQQHVPRLYPSICSHSSSLHDRADVDSSISSLVTLTHNTDAQEIVLLCEKEQTMFTQEWREAVLMKIKTKKKNREIILICINMEQIGYMHRVIGFFQLRLSVRL